MLDPVASKPENGPGRLAPSPRAAATGLLPDRSPEQTGIYLHFPYCIQKCDYCDFYSLPLTGESGAAEVGRPAKPMAGKTGHSVSADFLRAYRAGIETELKGRRNAFRDFASANTIYFGGGTSSLMPAEFIAGLLELFRGENGFEPDGAGVEITLEGNPENFTAAYLRELADAGVTRVNTGIQTFQGATLEAMNRYFDPERYESVLADLDASPIPNVGADLIYGLPGQSEEDFYRDLERILETRVNHLSLYSLTAEAGTAYANRINAGSPPPDDELQTRIFRALPDRLAEAGFLQYEISNFAKLADSPREPESRYGRPAFCRHNLRYWYYESYLALGPGAHGFDGRLRYGNARNLEKWLADPLHATLQDHDPTVDVALNVLRLTLPIPLALVRQIWSSLDEAADANRKPEQPGTSTRMSEAFEIQLDRWVRAGLAERLGQNGEFFQWSEAGVLQLDDRVLEMNAALEAAAGATEA